MVNMKPGGGDYNTAMIWKNGLPTNLTNGLVKNYVTSVYVK